MRSILAALDSSTISRLTKTWALLGNKYKLQLEAMRKLADHARNSKEYRQKLKATAPPAVPFLGKYKSFPAVTMKLTDGLLGLYLTDITFCCEGNPATRPSPLDKDRTLINFMKYHRLARIIQGMVCRCSFNH
jgi:son of sevenless